MLLFYRRRGVVEILRVLLCDHHTRALLPMPGPYTSITPSANADTLADTVSFELSSPVCPPKMAKFAIRSDAPATVAASKRCHSGLSEDAFDVRMARLSTCTRARRRDV